jgi:asparagine synthetase B (glutamine-hydrolysing)
LNRCLDIPYATANGASFPSSTAVGELESKLQDSMELRLALTAPKLGEKFAILFSGGVDCTVLALMADRVLPSGYPIDLLNVAFENPRVLAAAAKQDKSQIAKQESLYELCPDRKTGLSSYNELLTLCPARPWRFVAIDVPYSETMSYKSLVTSLMFPHNTEMDLSISLALFFASRGQGHIRTESGNLPYNTNARVLLSGLGADELFGGYTRHARAFAHSSFQGLLDELDLDFGRLPQRNFGRDDRIISYWGREIRYPYLDERLTSWALELPIWEKCGFHLESKSNNPIDGGLEPGKLILRKLAWNLGLKGAALEKKRAIQFGARTAKMHVGRTKGTDSIS